MVVIVTRAGKGSPLTHNEVDANFTNLNAGKVEGPVSATDNALARFDAATGNLLQDGVNIASDAGEISFPAVASPATPSAGRVNLFGTTLVGADRLGFIGPDGRVRVIQNDLGDCTAHFYYPAAGGAGGVLNLPVTFTGTAAAGVIGVTNLHTMHPRAEATAVAATNAVVGARANYTFVRIGADANAPGGFLLRYIWGIATGAANATHRAFCGLVTATGAPTDVEPSSLVNMVGMGWDAADATVQIMHNDAGGTATKIPLSASFAVPTTDRTEVFELQLYSPNDAAQSVMYRAIKYNAATKTIAAEETGTITTDIPSVTTLLGPRNYMSAGGTSSVVGSSTMGIVIATAY